MKTQNAKQTRFTSFLVFSLVIHVVLAALLYYAPRLAFMQELARRLDHSIEDKTEDVVTQIELINEEEERVNIVEQSDQSINDEVPEDEYFLSKNNQTVEKQTKAAFTGDFNNSSIPGANTAPQAASDGAREQAFTQNEDKLLPEDKPKTKAEKLGLNGLPLDDTLKNTLQSHKKKLAQEGRHGSAGTGLNQTNDYLPDVEVGHQTLLNTREFVYYSYFMRVREQIRSHWNPRVRHNVQLIFAKDERSLASVDTRATSLRVTLDKQGYLKKIELLKTSGFKELDVAAIEAFRAAAPFLNPPRGMVEKDGQIRILWDFILET